MKVPARLRYHHVGFPTDVPRPGETYLPQFKMHAAGFDTSPYGVEWLRFEADSPIHPLVQRVPHVAFVVDDLEAALEGQTILIEPNAPSPGIMVAFIEHDGAPIEFLRFEDPKAEIWPGSALQERSG